MTFVFPMYEGRDSTSDDRRAKIEREAYDWVMRFNAGDASQADLVALKQWSDRDPARAAAFKRISRTWKHLGQLRREADMVAAPSGYRAPPRMARRMFLGGVLAASAAGAAVLVTRPPLGLWPSLSELAADYRTGTGEQRRVVLADNTAIEMNTQTSVAIRAGADNRGGVDLIAGEAMFSAAGPASRQLVVHAADGRIVAEHARFNVRRQDHEVCVTCLDGDVAIESGNAKLVLSAQQQAIYSGSGIAPVAAVNAEQATAWRDGIVIFQMTPVSDVVAEVNRYRAGKVILTNKELGQRLFNARLRIANIDLVVPRIQQVFGARATTLPGGVVLLG